MGPSVDQSGVCILVISGDWSTSTTTTNDKHTHNVPLTSISNTGCILLGFRDIDDVSSSIPRTFWSLLVAITHSHADRMVGLPAWVSCQYSVGSMALKCTVLGRPFVKWFALCYQTVVCLSVCLSVCLFVLSCL